MFKHNIKIPREISNKEINYLDYGCGSGKNIIQLSLQYPNWKFFGYDKFNQNINDVEKKKNVSSSWFLNKRDSLSPL